MLSEKTCADAIARTIRALSPLCGKSFYVKDTSDPFYDAYEYTITASGKDMTEHVLPYLRNMAYEDYDEDYWFRKFGNSIPSLRPRKKYHVRIHDTFFYRFKGGIVENGYLV